MAYPAGRQLSTTPLHEVVYFQDSPIAVAKAAELGRCVVTGIQDDEQADSFIRDMKLGALSWYVIDAHIPNLRDCDPNNFTIDDARQHIADIEVYARNNTGPDLKNLVIVKGIDKFAGYGSEAPTPGQQYVANTMAGWSIYNSRSTPDICGTISSDSKLTDVDLYTRYDFTPHQVHKFTGATSSAIGSTALRAV